MFGLLFFRFSLFNTTTLENAETEIFIIFHEVVFTVKMNFLSFSLLFHLK